MTHEQNGETVKQRMKDVDDSCGRIGVTPEVNSTGMVLHVEKRLR